MKYKHLTLSTAVLLGVLSLPLNAANTAQKIMPEVTNFSVLSGDIIDVPFIYSSESSTATGIGVQLSFDSKKLLFLGFTQKMGQGLLAADSTAKPEAKDKDNDATTDAVATIAWASFDGAWLEEAQLPATLGVARFKVLETPDSVTRINITGNAAAKSTLSTGSVEVTIGQGEQAVSANATEGGGGGGSLPWLFIPLLIMLSLLKKAFPLRKYS